MLDHDDRVAKNLDIGTSQAFGGWPAGEQMIPRYLKLVLGSSDHDWIGDDVGGGREMAKPWLLF